MRKTQNLATTVVVAFMLFPIRTWGQEKPVMRELSEPIAKAAPIELATKPITVRLPMRSDAREQIEAAMAPAQSKIALTVEGIDYEKTPEVYYEVYVDLPKNETPNYKSAYFVGNLAFFRPHGGGAKHASVRSFDITGTVRALKSFKAWNDSEVSVTFVMRWLVDREGRELPVPSGVRLRFSNVKVVAIRQQSESKPAN